MREISSAASPEELGAAGRLPGNQIDAVHLWSIANFPLLGRQVLAPFGLVDLDRDVPALAAVLDFWKRAAAAFRADGELQAWDAGLRGAAATGPRSSTRSSPGRGPVGVDEREHLIRLNAALTSFLFLLYFDTRAGYQDTGPYPLADGRVLLVRDFNRFGGQPLPVEPRHLRRPPVLEPHGRAGARRRRARHRERLGHVDHRPARLLRPPVRRRRVHRRPTARSRRSPPGVLDDVAKVVKDAQRNLYRRIAGMSRREKLDAGAYVYFTFLRPFAEAAGVDDRLDWTVPRDSLDVYEGLATLERMPDVESDDSIPYYTPVPETGVAP